MINFALVEARVDYDLDTQKTLASAYGAENVGDTIGVLMLTIYLKEKSLLKLIKTVLVNISIVY